MTELTESRGDELRALSHLGFGELGSAARGIGQIQEAIAGRVFRAVGPQAAIVQAAHTTITNGVYGALHGATEALGRAADSVIVNGGTGICNTIYVDNLVHAIQLATRHRQVARHARARRHDDRVVRRTQLRGVHVAPDVDAVAEAHALGLQLREAGRRSLGPLARRRGRGPGLLEAQLHSLQRAPGPPPWPPPSRWPRRAW